MICNHCFEDMKVVDNCAVNTIIEFPDGTKIPTSTEHFNEPSGRCHDCGIKHGYSHHPGCDVEHCPKCKGQLISCGCLKEST